jgi:hypothetical protein
MNEIRSFFMKMVDLFFRYCENLLMYDYLSFGVQLSPDDVTDWVNKNFLFSSKSENKKNILVEKTGLSKD